MAEEEVFEEGDEGEEDQEDEEGLVGEERQGSEEPSKEDENVNQKTEEDTVENTAYRQSEAEEENEEEEGKKEEEDDEEGEEDLEEEEEENVSEDMPSDDEKEEDIISRLSDTSEDEETKLKYMEYLQLIKQIENQNRTVETIKRQLIDMSNSSCKTSCETNEIKRMQSCMEEEYSKLRNLMTRAMQLQNFGSKRRYFGLEIATTIDEDNMALPCVVTVAQLKK